MAIITSYPVVQPAKGDYLTGSKIDNTGVQVNPTKNFTVESVVNVVLSSLPQYDDNAAATPPPSDRTNTTIQHLLNSFTDSVWEIPIPCVVSL